VFRAVGHTEPMPERLSSAWWVGFSLVLAATCASVFVTAGVTAVFMRPNAFGARDGQGAAGLAALILLVSAAASLVSGVVLAIVTVKLRKRIDVGWAWPVALGVPLVVAVLAVSLATFGG